MSPRDLTEAVRRRPFVPFRLHVSDGTVYEIKHPELLMLAMTSAIVGLPSADQQPPNVERYEIVDVRHIVRLEPVVGSPPSGNGA